MAAYVVQDDDVDLSVSRRSCSLGHKNEVSRAAPAPPTHTSSGTIPTSCGEGIRRCCTPKAKSRQQQQGAEAKLQKARQRERQRHSHGQKTGLFEGREVAQGGAAMAAPHQ